jgi:hypothetical protein
LLAPLYLNGTGTLAEALATVRPFLDPILAGTATGTWDPEAAGWKPGSA